jgi:pantetheine-phosphate adenylyltransferase
MFIMASAKHSFLSSSAVREIASYGGDVSEFIPDEILETVVEAYADTQAGTQTDTGRIKTESKG